MTEAQKVYEFNVKMNCGGCSGAVNRALTKTEGVEKVDIDMDKQRVTVTTTEKISEDEVFTVIEKTGKAVSKVAAQ